MAQIEAWSRCHEILGIWLILFLQTCRKRKGRPRSQKVNHFICQGRFAIPSRSYRTLPQDWKIRFSYGSWCPSLPCCRLGILVRWNFGTCRKCCSWQQKVSYCAPSHHSCRQKRWRIEQVAWRSYYRRWRCIAQHPRCLVAQEEQISTRNFWKQKTNNWRLLSPPFCHKDANGIFPSFWSCRN